MNITILFEDNHLLILNKPANLPTQPSLEHSDSLETRAKKYIRDSYHKPGDVFLHAVHRLDKEVSGIVIFAKTSKALSRMNEQLKKRQIRKIYHAKVHGHLRLKQQKLVNFLIKKPYRAEIVLQPVEGAQEAVLLYRVLKEEDKTSLIEVELESGRYHQIRAQLAFLGHPILGDVKYGSTFSYPDKHIALAHVKVEFEHPVQKNTVSLNVMEKVTFNQ